MAGLNKNIFISYRRDDSAGHAGRLQDALTERFGAGHVFMDVSDLQPGQDYVVELDRALARADCVLAVIGPRWLGAVNAAGQRRIDDPGDLVCREIAAGLARQATVIPVLVHGATMPAAEAMPPPLQGLARRQAITLSDQRWERDLEELARLLGADDAAPPLRGASGRAKWIGVAALLALMLASGGVWMGLQSARGKPEAAAAPPAAIGNAAARPDATATVAATTGKTTALPQRYAIALPKVSEVRFRTHRAQFSFSILAIRLEPRDAGTQVLSVLLRMTNRGPLDEGFFGDQFRLIAGEQQIAPTATLIDSTEPNSAKETRLDFVLPSAVVDPLLEIRVGAESTRMPLPLSVRSPIANVASVDDFGQARPVRTVDAIKTLPATLAAGQRVDVGKIGYQIVNATIERETMEKASLTLTVRCTVPHGSSGTNFWSRTVRLWLDGVPRAPVNSVNEAVYAGDSKDARFVFDLLALPQTIEVGIFNSGDSAKLPLSLDAVPKR
jgi:TIR domain